jgi:hypothetical protein
MTLHTPTEESRRRGTWPERSAETGRLPGGEGHVIGDAAPDRAHEGNILVATKVLSWWYLVALVYKPRPSLLSTPDYVTVSSKQNLGSSQTHPPLSPNPPTKILSGPGCIFLKKIE